MRWATSRRRRFWPSSPVARRSASRAPRLRATLSLPKRASTSLLPPTPRSACPGAASSPTKATATPSRAISAGDSISTESESRVTKVDGTQLDIGIQVSMEAAMDHRGSGSSESRFSAYVEGLVSVIGHADRAQPLRDYCTGLMMPCERKSVEPMAAVTAPARVAAQHQSLLHFVGEGRWSDAPVLAKIREMVLPQMQRHGPIEAWIIDDTGFPKQGRHSVGVARQYCGQLGKEDNCQVAVSLSIANHHASLPVAYRLYLPQEWTNDSERLRKAGVPDDIGFKTKHEIALDQLRWACEAGLPRGVVLMDAGYGNHSELRAD